jgi:hypothetical protein
MAILVNKTTYVMGGIPIPQLYVRIQYTVDLSGKHLACNAYPYYDKNSFLENKNENVLSVADLKNYYEFSYDSSVNGDPLAFIHNQIKSVLSTDEMGMENRLDPSTGETILEAVIIKAKFAQDSSISFVDLD